MNPGCTAIFIKNRIPHHNIPYPTLNTAQTNTVQAYKNNNPFTVISPYIQPKRKTPSDPNINIFLYRNSLDRTGTLLILTSWVEILIVTTDIGIALEQAHLVNTYINSPLIIDYTLQHLQPHYIW
ncbi:hypothetical protein CDAR_308031 [Caerostris darwini]|uniref:Uncharacterized protein n=1 Tax=Caerostris darwini TaxID=1538125 RepID=A0AAV4VNX8_9ARAC|nr:hypothetical protein CDAR_308031 [Caerostris darwini]